MHANSRRYRQTPAKCAIANLLHNIGGYVVTRASCRGTLARDDYFKLRLRIKAGYYCVP